LLLEEGPFFSLRECRTKEDFDFQSFLIASLGVEEGILHVA